MNLTIDQQTCTRCGECLIECPPKAVQYNEQTGSYSIDQNICIQCSHCAAICPPGAVLSSESEFQDWKDPQIDPSLMKVFLSGKRSVRRYSNNPLTRDLIRQIISVGSLTATASNRQDWSAIVLMGGRVREFAERLFSFYFPLIRLARRPLVRLFLKFTPARTSAGKSGTLGRFEERLLKIKKGGDPFFYNAPAVVIMTHPKKNRQYGKVNCVLAAQAIMYYAQSMGIGSCIIGFAETALNIKRSMRSVFGIDYSQKVGLVFTLGYPDVKYLRLPIRKPIPVTFYKEEE